MFLRIVLNPPTKGIFKKPQPTSVKDDAFQIPRPGPPMENGRFQAAERRGVVSVEWWCIEKEITAVCIM